MNEIGAKSGPKRPRRKYFVERGLQTAFVLEVWVYLAAYTVLILGLMLFPAARAALRGSGDLESQLRAARQFLFLEAWMLPAVLALFILLGLFVVIRSNRFAGPVYRLKLITKQVGDGDLTVRIRLREKDFLQDFKDIYNDALESIAERLKSAQQVGVSEREELASLGAQLEQKKISLQDAVSSLKSLTEKHDELLRTLQTFKT